MSDLIVILLALAASFSVVVVIAKSSSAEAVELRKWSGKHKGGSLMLFVLLFSAIVNGSTKYFSWGEFLSGNTRNGEQLSCVTNNLVHVEWVADGLPFDDTIFVAAKPQDGSRDYEEIQGVSALVGDGYLDFTFENATNYFYFVFSRYIPPSPVVTNGVFHLSGFCGESLTNVIPTRVGVVVKAANGEKRIAPMRVDENGNLELEGE